MCICFKQTSVHVPMFLRNITITKSKAWGRRTAGQMEGRNLTPLWTGWGARWSETLQADQYPKAAPCRETSSLVRLEDASAIASSVVDPWRSSSGRVRKQKGKANLLNDTEAEGMKLYIFGLVLYSVSSRFRSLSDGLPPCVAEVTNISSVQKLPNT